MTFSNKTDCTVTFTYVGLDSWLVTTVRHGETLRNHQSSKQSMHEIETLVQHGFHEVKPSA